MDAVETTSAESPEADPKVLLSEDVERARSERDELERQIAADRSKLFDIRVALDTMVTSVWRDVFGQQQAMRSRDTLTSALTFGWMGFYQIPIAALFLIVTGAAIYTLQANGFVLAVAVYLVLAAIGYFIAREQSTGPIKKARASYLGADGKDVRFVAFARLEPGLSHPLIGYDGPSNGQLEDRSWKIPGVRDADAMNETFVEVIDERRSNVLLTRFPDKKPTLVHADLENPFIRSYGVFLQRALERQMPHVAQQAKDFRELVARYGERKTLDDRVRRMEEELREYDGTAAIIRGLLLPTPIRNRLIRQVVLFRLDDPAVRRGCMLIGTDRIDLDEVMQGVARAASATLLPLSFSEMKIGYVGQGAATVSRIFTTARRARSIIYISEAERLFSQGVTTAYEAMRQEIVTTIWSEWSQLEGQPVWVIAGANTREGLDESVISRFGSLIDMGPVLVGSGAETMVIDTSPVLDESEAAPVDLPEPVIKQNRVLAAMFAHVGTMEAQGITVPRAVLVSGAIPESRERAVANIVAVSGLPLVTTTVEELEGALTQARADGSALVSFELPPYGDPGTLAHLAVTIEGLVLTKEPIFLIAQTYDASQLDPELLQRFPEVVDLTELPPEARRELLRELLDGKPVGFDLNAALDDLEARTDGMTAAQMRHFVEEASRHAAVRAIDAGVPDHVIVEMVDFERRPAPDVATKDDEAAL
jgi:hypothetical protein